MSRNIPLDGDDDGFSSYKGPQKREEKSRKELLGVSGPRVPKAKARQQAAAAQAAQEQEEADKFRGARVTEDSYGFDPYSDNPLRRAEQQELEQQAVKKSKDVTSDLRNVLKLSEETKGIGAQTLITLKAQGEQIARTHEKAVVMEQEISRGDKLLSQLGPLFSFGWKPKKGKKITGPTYQSDESMPSGDASSRGELMGGKKGGVGTAGAMKTKQGNYMDDVEDETSKQDDMFDQLSLNLAEMKNQAMTMGKVMDIQDTAMDGLKEDLTELQSRQKQATQRGRRILRS